MEQPELLQQLWQLASSSPLIDKLLGMWLAHAMGDALGAPLEFAAGVCTGVLSQPLIIRSRWQGSRTGVVGQVTDDTMMTLAAINSLVKIPGFSYHHMVLSYMEFANNTSLLGKNTRALFKGIKQVSTYQEHWNKAFQADIANGDYQNMTRSNGSLMRASALVGLADDAIVADIMLTNPHSHNRECGLSYVTLLRGLIKGQTVEACLSVALVHVQNSELQQLWNNALNGQLPDLETNRGLVSHAWAAAVMAVNASSYLDWITGLLNKYPRSDTDTVAAIAGAIIGAKYGLKALMADSRVQQNLVVLLSSDPSQGQFPILEHLHPRQYLRIAAQYAQLATNCLS